MKLKQDDLCLQMLVSGLFDSNESHQSPRADLPSAVTALTCQVMAVSQEAWGPSALER